jgi:hypothetical protein
MRLGAKSHKDNHNGRGGDMELTENRCYISYNCAKRIVFTLASGFVIGLTKA